MKTSIFILISLDNFLDFIKQESQDVDRIHIITPVENLGYTEDYLKNLIKPDTEITISTNIKIKNVDELIKSIGGVKEVTHIFAFEEYCLLSAALLRQRFKVDGMTPNDVYTFRDKKLLKKRNRKLVKIPYTEEYEDYKQVLRLLRRFKKVIAKRMDGMGSKDMAIFTSDLTDAEIKEIASNIREDKSYIIQEFIDGQVLSIIFEGADWGGVWHLRVYYEGLKEMGYEKIPTLIYTPQILDNSGSKLSKRKYVGGDSAYRGMFDEYIVNISLIKDELGDDAIKKLWEHFSVWVSDPKYFFRDYTVNYLLEEMKEVF